MHIIAREHCILPEHPAEGLNLGDRVAFTLSDWDGGDVTFEGVVTAIFFEGAYRVRTGDEAVYKVPMDALQRVTTEGAAP